MYCCFRNLHIKTNPVRIIPIIFGVPPSSLCSMSDKNLLHTEESLYHTVPPPGKKGAMFVCISVFLTNKTPGVLYPPLNLCGDIKIASFP